MSLIDFIPFQCIRILLNETLLIPVDPEVNYIVFFINIHSEIIKMFCRKVSDDGASVNQDEINIPWEHIKNVTIMEADDENRIVFFFVSECSYKVCELVVNSEVLDKLEGTLALMLVRLHRRRYGRSEQETRDSIRVLSIVEDSDFGLEEDMIKSASSSNSKIVSDSFEAIESSQDALATRREEFQETVEETPYHPETSPVSPYATQEDVIPNTPARSEVIVNYPKPRNLLVYEDTLSSQKTLKDFYRSEPESLSEEIDYVETQSDCSDSEPDNDVEMPLSNLKNIAQAIQEENIAVTLQEEHIPEILQEENITADVSLEKQAITSQEYAVVPVSKKVDVITLNGKKGTEQIVPSNKDKFLYHEDFFEPPADLVDNEPCDEVHCSAKKATEVNSKKEIILLNDIINKDVSPENVAAPEFQETPTTPKPALRRSRRSSILEINDYIEFSNNVSPESNDDSQTLQKILPEDEEIQKKTNKTSAILNETVLNLKRRIQMEEMAKESESQKESKTDKDKKEKKTAKKNQKKTEEQKTLKTADTSKTSKISVQTKNEEVPKKKYKTVEKNELNDISLQFENKENVTPTKQLEGISESFSKNEEIENIKQKKKKPDMAEKQKQTEKGKKRKKPTENPAPIQNETASNSKTTSFESEGNSKIEIPSKRIPKKINTPSTPSKKRKRRAADSDSDEWTPGGIKKFKKQRKSVSVLDEEPEKESFFSSYSRGATITKTRTRVVTRSSRFGDELNAEPATRRKRTSSLSCESDDNFMKTVMVRRNSTNIPPNYYESQESESPSYSYKPDKSVIVKNRTQSTSSTLSMTPSVPKIPRRRLSHTAKFSLNTEPEARKCTLPFSLVENEEEFKKSFEKNLSQNTLGFQSEPEETAVSETDLENGQSEIEEAREPPEKAGKPPDPQPVTSSSSPLQNGGSSQNSDMKSSIMEEIPSTDPSKRPYKAFPVFTSESSSYYYSSPESPKQKIFLQKNTSFNREIKRARCMQTKSNFRRRKTHATMPKKPKENNAPSAILPGLTTPELETPPKINELNVQTSLDAQRLQINDIDIIRRRKAFIQLNDKVKQTDIKNISEKQFYSLGIEVFTLCQESSEIYKNLKSILLLNFNKTYNNYLNFRSS